MAKLYLYGIVNSPKIDKITSNGIKNIKPYYVSYKDIGMVVGNFSEEIIDVNYENLSKHDEVIYELMKKYCILPVAFRNILVNEANIKDFMTKNYDQIKLNFEKLLNKCEMGLKVIWDINKIKQEINSDNKKTKRNYFNADTQAKRYIQEKMNLYYYQNELDGKADQIKEKIIKELEEVCNIYKFKLLQSEKMAVNGAFLIHIGVKEKFISAVERLRDNNKDLAFLLSGPWAPYNFVEIEKNYL